MNTSRVKKYTFFALKTLLTAGALSFVLYETDWQHFWEITRNQNASVYLWVVGIFVLQAWLATLRWFAVIRMISPMAASHTNSLHLFRLNFIAMFFNACLPGTVGGDAVRAYMLKSEHLAGGSSLHSVVLDRLIALVVLLIMVMATMPYLAALLHISYTWPMIGLAALMTVGLMVVWHGERGLRFAKKIAFGRWMLELVSHMKRLLCKIQIAGLVLIYAAGGHLCFCLAAYLLAQSLAIEITAMQCITLLPIILLSTMIPVSIGGWGVREAGMVGLLGLIGIAKEPALALSIQMGLLGGVIVALPGAPLWLLHQRRRKTS